MADHLPWDLIVLILLRLPSKSVIRFRLACKSWLSLISSTHFRLMYPLSSNFSRTLVRRVWWREKKEIYTVHLDDQHFTLDTGVSIEFPFNLHRGGDINSLIIGCCNGVICLSDDISETDETILWNPCIRRTLTLNPPIHRNNESQDRYLVFGFGYDIKTDDYKVVRLTYINGPGFTPPHVQVYTVKTAIWRVVEFPHDLHCSCICPQWETVSMVFDGSAHWIADSHSTPSYSSILTFDMSTERFGEIQLPESSVLKNGMQPTVLLGVVDESLGVFCSDRPFESISITGEIWVMKEYKNPASWTMLYDKHYPDEDVRSALGVTNNGNLITEIRGGLKIHNQEGCYNFLFGLDSQSIFVERYEESLALLDVGDDVNVKIQELEDGRFTKI